MAYSVARTDRYDLIVH